MYDSTKFDIFQQNSTGQLPVSMCNDYLFKAINQKNQLALKSLASAVLRIPPEQIETIEIMNPILLGAAIDEKEFVLDIKARLSPDTVADFEMQVVNHQDWPERSLQYLCRTYNSLNRGQH